MSKSCICKQCGASFVRKPNTAGLYCSCRCSGESRRIWPDRQTLDREWKRKWRAENPDIAKQKQREWWATMAAALLAVKEVLGEPTEQRRVGARREGPIKPLPQDDIVIARVQKRQCVCCGADISARPTWMKVCSASECHRERARLRAAEFRWKNIDLVREKERARSAAKREQNKPRLARWRQERREHLIAKGRSRYRENGDAIRAQQYDRYIQLRAARSLIKELQPEIRHET